MKFVAGSSILRFDFCLLTFVQHVIQSRAHQVFPSLSSSLGVHEQSPLGFPKGAFPGKLMHADT